MRRRPAWAALVVSTLFLLGGEPPSRPESGIPLLPRPLPAGPGDPVPLRGVPLPPIGSGDPKMPVLPPPRPLPGAGGERTSPVSPDLQTGAQRLREEREALAAERDKIARELKDGEPAQDAEELRLRARLAELVSRIKSRGAEKQAPRPVGPPAGGAKPEPAPGHAAPPAAPPPPGAELGKPGDPFTLAQALFRAGEYTAALQAYRRIDPDGLPAPEKVVVQYMTACCLRKLGRSEEAAALYREVANAREDEVLTDCALWHLNAINWRRDVEKQLEEIRRRREALR